MASIHHLRELARIAQTFGNKSTRLLFQAPKNLGRPSKVKRLAIKFAEPLPAGTSVASGPSVATGMPLSEMERAWAGEILDCREYDRRYIVLRSKIKRLMLHRLFHLDIRSGEDAGLCLPQNAAAPAKI